jgi:hypothetical protein
MSLVPGSSYVGIQTAIHFNNLLDERASHRLSSINIPDMIIFYWPGKKQACNKFTIDSRQLQCSYLALTLTA